MKAQILFGFHAIASRLKARANTVDELFVSATREERHDARMDKILALAKASGVRVLAVDNKRLDGMTGNATIPVAAICR